MSPGLQALTVVHVAISLVAIGAGIPVVLGFLSSRRLPVATVIFLVFTALTSITGFFFPFHGFTPAFGFGIVSLLILPLATWARYGKHLSGAWRGAYIVTTMIALYLNVFVLILQSFLKIPALKALAPNQNEPPFAIAQGVVLVLFVALTIVAVKKFRPPPSEAADSSLRVA